MHGTLRILLLCLVLVVATLFPQTASSADFSAIWDGGSGNWSDPLHWNTDPNYPNNGGGFTYDATINAGSVTLDRNITIQRLYLNNGTLSGAFELALNEGITWTAGRIGSSATVKLMPGSTSSIHFGSLDGTLNNHGIMNLSGTVGDPASVVLSDTGIINNSAKATWNFQGSINPFVGMFTPPSAGQVNNAGNMIVSPVNTPEGINYLRTSFNNTGTVTLTNMANLFVDRGSASGAFDLGAQTTLNLGSYTLASGAIISGAGTVKFGAVTVTGDTTISANLVNQAISVQSGATLRLDGAYTGNPGAGISVQSGATLRLNGTYSDPFGTSVQLNGGTIISVHPITSTHGGFLGSGTINADINLVNGFIIPGASAGKLTINGSLSMQNSSPNPAFRMEIGGLKQGLQYDYLAVNGVLVLDGRLQLFMLNGFQFQLDPGQTFTLMTSTGLSGAFDNIANGTRLTTDDNLASFIVNYGPDSPYGINNVVLSDPQVVPEPASVVLFAGGAFALGLFRVCRR
jgi:hypothetical protein